MDFYRHWMLHKMTFKASMDLAKFSQYVSEGVDPVPKRTRDACTCLYCSLSSHCLSHHLKNASEFCLKTFLLPDWWSSLCNSFFLWLFSSSNCVFITSTGDEVFWWYKNCTPVSQKLNASHLLLDCSKFILKVQNYFKDCIALFMAICPGRTQDGARNRSGFVHVFTSCMIWQTTLTGSAER